MCGDAHSHKNCPNKEKRTSKCGNSRGPHVANYRGCPAYKDQAFRQHVIHNQVSYASIVKQASPPPPNNTINFTAEQIVSLVTNVVIQIAQPQLCTKNLPEKQVQAKSDLSKQIAETAKKCLGANIEGKDVFESIISWPAPPPSALCLQLHAGRQEESSSESFYGLKQGRTIIRLIITLHQIHKKP